MLSTAGKRRLLYRQAHELRLQSPGGLTSSTQCQVPNNPNLYLACCLTEGISLGVGKGNVKTVNTNPPHCLKAKTAAAISVFTIRALSTYEPASLGIKAIYHSTCEVPEHRVSAGFLALLYEGNTGYVCYIQQPRSNDTLGTVNPHLNLA